MSPEGGDHAITPRLLVLTVGELTRDPRARRQVLAAVSRGWHVAGACGRFPGEQPVTLADIQIVRLGTGELYSQLRPVARAAGATGGSLSRELRGLYQLMRFARLTYGLVRVARRIGPSDVVHANDIDTLPAAWILARLWKAKYVYDSHEFYMHKEPRPPRSYRFIARRLERQLARKADAIITVSDSIADELVRTLRLASRPTIALNCPELQIAPRKISTAGPLRVVYQASVGIARFPEDVLDAVAATHDVEVTLRIAGIDPSALTAEIAARGLASRVRVADPVQPDQLVTALGDFDVGLVIDRPVTLNVAFALPNKLFEYLMAGLAVVVPAHPAMGALVRERHVGLTFEPGNPKSLAAALQRLTEDRALLSSCQQRARAQAVEDLNAAHQMRKVAALWRTLSGVD